jgi:transposase
VKNDAREAADLADVLRMGRLPESWIAPPPVRELREQVRHRAKLVALRSGLKAQVHAVLAKQGVAVPMSDLFGVGGTALLDRLRLDPAYAARVGSLRRVIDLLDFEIDVVSKRVAVQLSSHDGYRAVQALPGVGKVLAAVFVAEIGDVTRFPSARQLTCWAGLTPRHRESDTTVHRGPITKQGSRLVRWAAIEAVQRTPSSAGWLVATRAELTGRRGPQHRHHRGRPPAADPGLLRAAGRAHPRPGPRPAPPQHHGGGVNRGSDAAGRVVVACHDPRSPARSPI